tara:strand:- start:1339 stop:2061 length:723 start_codon:yes stop_codon:yes gene_type:complete
MRVFVLGHRGMLGHMVCKVLLDNGINIVTTDSKWPDCKWISNFDGNYVVNCIGTIPKKIKNFEKSDYSVNYELPIWLDKNMKCRVIHVGTDLDGYSEYGDSKYKAESHLLENGTKTKIIKSSIIGPELYSKNSLFEWFMQSKNEVSGEYEAYWNGITTLQWAKICKDLILDWDYYPVLNKPHTDCISKYELLKIIKDVFKKNISINKSKKNKVDMCLNGTMETPNIKKQIIKLKEFYYDN